MTSIVRLSAGAAALASLVLLAGCNTSQKVFVAEINGEPITADEYYARVLSVTNIPESFNTDAGGVTMINMIRDRLTDQLARKHNAVPTDEAVNAAVDYQMNMDPTTNAQVTAGKLTREDLLRQKKFELEAFGIGTNGDKASDKEIDKAYEEYKDKPDFRVKAAYKVKIIQVPDDATGRKIIAELKQTGDFKSAAKKALGMPDMDAANAAKDQKLLADQLRPELREALDKLKPNEITPAPIGIKIANPQQPLAPQFVYAVAQLKGKDPERVLTKSELRFLLVPVVLQKTHADWKEHYRRELADFTQHSKMHVGLAKYESLPDSFVRPLANTEANGHPTVGMPTPQPGAPQ